MIQKSCPVTSSKKIVGEAIYYEYQSIAEAIESLGEQDVLDRLNSQVKTDAMNRVRSEYNSGPSKEKLRNAALSKITTTPELLQRLQQVGGDTAAIEKLLLEVMDGIEAEFRAQREAQAAEIARKYPEEQETA